VPVDAVYGHGTGKVVRVALMAGVHELKVYCPVMAGLEQLVEAAGGPPVPIELKTHTYTATPRRWTGAVVFDMTEGGDCDDESDST
jgi:hypothetical protein